MAIMNSSNAGKGNVTPTSSTGKGIGFIDTKGIDTLEALILTRSKEIKEAILHSTAELKSLISIQADEIKSLRKSVYELEMKLNRDIGRERMIDGLKNTTPSASKPVSNSTGNSLSDSILAELKKRGITHHADSWIRELCSKIPSGLDANGVKLFVQDEWKTLDNYRSIVGSTVIAKFKDTFADVYLSFTSNDVKKGNGIASETMLRDMPASPEQIELRGKWLKEYSSKLGISAQELDDILTNVRNNGDKGDYVISSGKIIFKDAVRNYILTELFGVDLTEEWTGAQCNGLITFILRHYTNDNIK